MNDRMEKIELDIKNIQINVENSKKSGEEVKYSLETHQNLVDNKINETKNHIKVNENNIDTIFNKLRIQEDRSRRNNIRIDGIKENENETWQECKMKVGKFLETNFNLKDIRIERAHRIKSSSAKAGPKTIVAKILDWDDKQTIINRSSELKNTGFFINEDFSAETLEIRKKLWSEVKDLRRKGKYAVIKYDRIYQSDFRKNR